MSLTGVLGSILDDRLACHPAFTGFIKLKTSGLELRSFYGESEIAQYKILIYRDKRWTNHGGTLFGELFCLLPAVQLALCGKTQSLAKPDYATPFHHFQFGLLTANPERSWSIHSESDVAAFSTAIESWLTATAAPWLAQFHTFPTCIEFMARHERFVDLALLHAAQENPAQSRACIHKWISKLPRQIDKTLARLQQAGVLSESEHSTLSRASMQNEDRYRQTIAGWISDSPQQ